MDEEWQTKMSNLKERAEMLFKTQELSDCEFVVGPQKTKISGHKLFLAISSPVFNAMFFGDMAEKKTVEIIDIEPDAFKGMLQYIYSDHVDFESCLHACEVFNAATKYMLPFLEQYCIKFLRGNVDASSACEVYEFAKFHDNSDMKDLKDVCIKILRNSTQDVLKSASFLETDSTVLTILEQDMLEVDNKDWADAEAAGTVLGEKGVVKCRHCSGDHRTLKCPYKDMILSGGKAGLDENKPIAAAEPSAAEDKKTKYVPTSLRDGAKQSGGSSMNKNFRDDSLVIRVSNLSERTQNADLKDLAKPFGPTSKLYLAKDKISGLCKGFAYIHFRVRSDAQKAKLGLHGHVYDHLILSVD